MIYEFPVTLVGSGNSPEEAWATIVAQIEQHLPPAEDAISSARDATHEYEPS